MTPINVALSGNRTNIADANATLELVMKAIPKIEHRIKSMGNSDNPQVTLAIAKEQARVETLLAVESALLGNKVDLRTMAD